VKKYLDKAVIASLPEQTEAERDHWAESHECAMLFLDDEGVRRGGEDIVGGTYSLVGRIREYKHMVIEDELEKFKVRCNGADPTHFCNNCGSEFGECCWEHMHNFKDLQDDGTVKDD